MFDQQKNGLILCTKVSYVSHKTRSMRPISPRFWDHARTRTCYDPLVSFSYELSLCCVGVLSKLCVRNDQNHSHTRGSATTMITETYLIRAFKISGRWSLYKRKTF